MSEKALNAVIQETHIQRISTRSVTTWSVSVAIILAVGVNSGGRREVLGMTIGHSEAKPFWVEFLRNLARRLRGVKLVVSDPHERLKAAVTKVLSATWQRCRVRFMRNALA